MGQISLSTAQCFSQFEFKNAPRVKWPFSEQLSEFCDIFALATQAEQQCETQFSEQFSERLPEVVTKGVHFSLSSGLSGLPPAAALSLAIWVATSPAASTRTEIATNSRVGTKFWLMAADSNRSRPQPAATRESQAQPAPFYR